MEEKPIEVLLFGLGAIGGFYAFILSRNANVRLSVVARSNYEVVKRNGLRIESKTHGKHLVDIVNVYKHPSEASQPFDYIVCAHKAIDQTAVAASFDCSARNDETTFVLAQNGIGNEDAFRLAFPNNTLLSAVVWIGATQTEPGLIRHASSENTELGLLSHPPTDPPHQHPRLDHFASLLRNGGTHVSVVPDAQIPRWEKVVWNCAWNPLTTLTGVDTQTWLASSPAAVDVTRRLMREVVAVARACGVPLGFDLVDTLLTRIGGMPGLWSSMHTDMVRGNALEVDVIVGAPVRKAAEHQVDVPTLRAVYAMTVAVNQRITSGRGGD